MTNILRSVAPGKHRLLFSIALAGKSLLFLFLLIQHEVLTSGPWYAISGDSIGYMEPAESMIRGNGYHPDYRMPGYTIVFWMFRLLFSPEAALYATIILQVVADALGVVLLADIAWNITRNERAHRWTFWLALISIYVTFYDRYVLTESLTTFCLIAALHGTVIYVRDGKVGRLLFAGAMLTATGFMRPPYLPLVPLFCLGVLLAGHGSLRTRSLHTLALAVPMILADGAWVARNFAVHGVFRPMSDGVISPELRAGIKYPVMRITQALGGNHVWWDPRAEIRWFNIILPNELVDTTVTPPPFPTGMYHPVLNADSLRLIRNDVARWASATDSVEARLIKERVRERCDRYIADLAREKPFHYQVASRLRLLRIFVVESGTAALMHDPWSKLSIAEKAVKLFYSTLYLGVMLIGPLAACVMLRGRTFAGPLRVIPITLLYGVLAFPFLVRLCENRYLAVVYPLSVLFTVIGVDAFLLWFKLKRRPTNTANTHG